MNASSHARARAKGFTLIELIIVITILVILGIVVVVLIDPAEILAQSRDSQRISDLATIKGAAQIVLSNRSASANEISYCDSSGAPESVTIPNTKIWASTVVAGTSTYNFVSATSTRTQANGLGWIRMNFAGTSTSESLGSGVALSNLPVDPTNTYGAAGLYYRWGCNSYGGRYQYEVDAALESAKYKPSCVVANCDDKGLTDGGNSNTPSGTPLNNRYEVGNNLYVLPASALSS